MRFVRTVRLARKPRTGWPMPQFRHAGLEADEPEFTQIPRSNIEGKSKPSIH